MIAVDAEFVKGEAHTKYDALRGVISDKTLDAIKVACPRRVPFIASKRRTWASRT